MDSLSELNAKIRSKNCIVGIVGLGYVGLPLALRYAEAGYSVLGFDVDHEKVDSINRGKSYIKHIGDAAVSESRERGFIATTSFGEAKTADALIICVPTPLDRYREPDLRFVIQTVESLLPHMRSGQLLSLESTTYPGTTEEEIKTRIENAGFAVGKDVFVIYSPEREDPGNLKFKTQTIPKVVGGCTDSCLEAGVELYSCVIDKVVPVSSTKTAELTKLLENIHRSVNIGLVNEMKIIADRMQIDIYEVIRAAATKPFGFVPYYPGPGLGGHCIPIDPFYLSWKAREYGMHTRFIELAGEINRAMPEWVVGKVSDALNDCGKAVNGSKILILGISYKKNIDDTRESPSVEIMELLKTKGAHIAYSDPWVDRFPKMREHYFDLESVAIVPEEISSYDAVIIATDHDLFDYNVIKQNASLIVDARGVYEKSEKNIVKA